MQKIIKNILYSKVYGPLIFVLFFSLAPYFITLLILDDKSKFLLYFSIILIIIIIIFELLFNFIFRLLNGRGYKKISKIPFKSMHIQPHPYLPFISKKNFETFESEPARYPLHDKKFILKKLKLNNLGFSNGIDGGRNITMPKPSGLYRINCLGASTTANYISTDKQNFSYPQELEKKLTEKLNKKLEVNNCGQGGYNSADLLIRFILQINYTQPDAIIIYHAYNDIKSYLTPNLETDYSHSTKNLSEQYWKFALSSKFPNLPINFYNFFVNKWLPSNIRWGLMDYIKKGKVDAKIDFNSGIKIYKKNIENIIHICKANNIDVYLSTFCHFLHQDIKDDSLNILYDKIVEKENEAMKEIAKKFEIKIVDTANLIPKEEKYFVDSTHFTPEGMKFLANSISTLFNK